MVKLSPKLQLNIQVILGRTNWKPQRSKTSDNQQQVKMPKASSPRPYQSFQQLFLALHPLYQFVWVPYN